jgi:hypothetical protein
LQRYFNQFLVFRLDGFAILSKFEIDGPRIKFQKKYLQSDAYQKAITAQKPLITEFATKAYANPANKNFLSRFISSLVSFTYFIKA